MKKVLKILSIILVAIVVAVGLYWGFFFLLETIKDSKLDHERINGSTTLSKYIEYHDTEHTRDIETSLDFYAKDIKCDMLKDRNILYYNEDILVLDDYTIYETAFRSDKTYSNGQQCKQIETDIKIDRIQISHYTLYLISTDNKYYTINLTDKSLMKAKPSSLDKMFLDDTSIVRYIDATTNEYANTYKSKYIVLKDDGQIYSQEYERKYNNSQSDWQYTLLEEKVLLSNENYGKITDFIYSKDLWNVVSTQDIVLDKERVILAISDKGLYYIKQTSEQKYIDSEATYELVASKIYNKYKKDIKFINSRFVFTTDNNIIRADMLCRDIDKEVK